MITELERVQLKELFGGRYAEEIQKILSLRMVLNRNGEPHSLQYIRMVFQGVRNNPDIESAIWQLAITKKKALDLQKTQKKNILDDTS
jgi:hypothetical protein